MSIKKKTVTELLQDRNSMIEKREAIDIKMNAIADKAAAEKRELSAEENVEYQQLQSEFDKHSRELAMIASQIDMAKEQREKHVDKNILMREAVQAVRKGEQRGEFVLQREFTGIETADLTAGGMIPITIKDVLPPLEMGLIYDKVGIPVQTGVTGDLQWPVMGTVEAEIKGETLELTDQEIDFSKIVAKKVRLGITIPVTNQAINESYTDLVALIQQQMQLGVTRTLNRVMFSHENFTADLHGPFAGASASGEFAGTVPTFAELIAMKGAVAATGVQMTGFCYVMSEAMKASLEATPKDAGSGQMVIENGTIAGYPVFTTEFINYGDDKTKASVEYIAAGCFGYMAMNQHGPARLIVDPFSQAKKDIVQITLNADWSITTLRNEAFALYKTAAAE